MKTQLKLGLALTLMTFFSGCCCPMTCGSMCGATSCWMEQLHDNYSCTTEMMHEHACQMNQAICCHLQDLQCGSECSCQCEHCLEESHQNCDQPTSGAQCDEGVPKVRRKLEGPRC